MTYVQTVTVKKQGSLGTAGCTDGKVHMGRERKMKTLKADEFDFHAEKERGAKGWEG